MQKNSFNEKLTKFFSLTFYKNIYLIFKEIPFHEIFNLKKMKLFMICRKYSMNNWPSLSIIYDLSKRINYERIGGNFVECGCCNGGAGAMSTAFLREREFWLFDCFEGLPIPSDSDVKNDTGEKAKELWKPCWDKGSVENVKDLYFNKLKIDEKKVHIIKGLFQKTVPEYKNKIGKIALLHLDGDWYESTKICIENLFDKVEKKGFIIVDDYGHWRGCKKAIDEFFKKKNISPQLHKVDYTRVYFIKE